MITHAYAIYDRKGLLYNVPFFAITDGSAVRSFADLANDPQTTIGRHPMDYVLFRVGSFDDSSGMLFPLDAIIHVSDAAAHVHDVRTGDLFAQRSNGADQPAPYKVNANG